MLKIKRTVFGEKSTIQRLGIAQNPQETGIEPSRRSFGKTGEGIANATDLERITVCGSPARNLSAGSSTTQIQGASLRTGSGFCACVFARLPMHPS